MQGRNGQPFLVLRCLTLPCRDGAMNSVMNHLSHSLKNEKQSKDPAEFSILVKECV